MATGTTNGTNGNGQDKDLMIVEGEIMPATTVNMPLVIQLADRLMSLHPAARDVGIDAMRTVAQLALTTGANPLPGANGIHAWKDNKGKVAIAFGIGFWRGEAEKAGGVLWAERPRPMSLEERKQWNIPDGIIAAYCRGALGKDVFGLMRKARQAGINLSLKEAKEEVAQDGVGTVNQGEYLKMGRPATWTATERAERDMLRKLVPIMKDARQRTIEGEFVRGGLDWGVGEFVNAHDAEPLPAGYDYHDANADLWGDSPAVNEVEEGTFEEAPTMAEPAAVDPIPMDWMVQISNAEDLDVWAAGVYQLTQEVTKDANEVKRGYDYLFGTFDPANNVLTWEIFRGYASAVADGVPKKKAAAAAKDKFTAATSLQPAIPTELPFGDEQGGGAAYQE